MIHSQTDSVPYNYEDILCTFQINFIQSIIITSEFSTKENNKI